MRQNACCATSEYGFIAMFKGMDLHS